MNNQVSSAKADWQRLVGAGRMSGIREATPLAARFKCYPSRGARIQAPDSPAVEASVSGVA
jgi:hypothetical protein